MSRIVHVALKVDDVDTLSSVYRELFGFVHTGTIVQPVTKSGGRTVRSGYIAHHLNDGVIDFALVHYEDDEYADAGSCGSQRTGIHHFGIEDADPEAAAKRIRAHGGEVLTEPGILPVKFSAPGGIIAEVIPEHRFTAERITQAAKAAKKREIESGQQPSTYAVASLELHEGPVRRAENAPAITHLACKVDDCERAAQFFHDVFDFKIVERRDERDRKSVHLSDGAFALEFVSFHDGRTPIARFAGEEPCIHHFAVDVGAPALERMVPRLRELGCEFAGEPGARTVMFKIPPDGTVVALGRRD